MPVVIYRPKVKYAFRAEIEINGKMEFRLKAPGLGSDKRLV